MTAIRTQPYANLVRLTGETRNSHRQLSPVEAHDAEDGATRTMPATNDPAHAIAPSTTRPSAAGAPSAAGLSHDQLVLALREELVEISDGELGLDEIDPQGHLFDFGYVDSLRAVMLLARIEERFGVEIEDMDLVENLTTVDAVAARIRERS
jgi:D-alanine--poly(phosphoribitol) ligase subunit 2